MDRSDSHFGATLGKYSWSQTVDDVTVTIPIASSIRARNIDCRIEPNYLYVCIRGESTPILNGTTFQRIKVDNSLWTIDNEGTQRVLRIDLDKNEGPHWWPYVVEGEPAIDVSKIDPPPVTLETLDGSLRSQVEKMMYDQQQKEMNKPTSDEQHKQEVLKRFMQQHPEMDFSNAIESKNRMDSIYLSIPDSILGKNEDGKFPQLEKYINESIIPLLKEPEKKEVVMDFIYELIWSYFNGRFNDYYLVSLLMSIQRHSPDLFSTMLCDLFWMIGQEVDPAFGYKNPEVMKNYVTIVKRCERELLCKLSELKCRLEVDKLIACGFVGEDFSKCIIRKYTQRHYTQQKFNLIRDENEGYSRLLSFLHQSNLDSSILFESILNHIGIFSLDPNRVFDLMLDVCEFEQDKYVILKPLFYHFKISNIEQLIGFKVLYYRTHDNRKIPSSLITLIIKLIHDDILSFDFLLNIVVFEEKEMNEYAKQRITTVYQTIQNMRKITPDMVKTVNDLVPLPDSINSIQFLLIGCTFLSYDQIMILWKRIRDTGMNPCWFKDCNKALCRFFSYFSTYVYSEITPFPSITSRYSQLKHKAERIQETDRITDISLLIQKLQEPLSFIGPFISKESVFYSIVCRILSYYIQQHQATFLTDPLYSTIETIYRTILIPSLSYATPNVTVAHEIWEGLQYFSQQVRFSMYSYWQSEEITKDSDLLFYLKKHYLSIDYHFRRTDGTNVKEKAKTLVYYCYATPLYFFQNLIFKCQTFDNFINLFIPNLTALTEIAIDCGMYCILDALEGRSSKIEENGVTLNKGFSLTIDFASSYVKCFATKVDISLLMQYITTQLQQGDIVVSLLLNKLISKVANSPSPLDTITPTIDLNTLRCLSSSLLSQFITRSTNPSKSSLYKPKLIQAILSSSLLPTFLFQFPHSITDIIYSNENDDLNKLSILTDRYYDVFTHMLLLLRGNPSYIQFLQSTLPSPSSLFLQYHLDIQYIFAIIRSFQSSLPFLQSLTSPPNQTNPWELRSSSNQQLISHFYPSSIWNEISYEGYLVFWLLEYQDLATNSTCYDEYVKIIETEIMNKQKKITSRTERQITKGINELKKEIETIQKEKQQQEEHVHSVDELLKSVISSFFCTEDIDCGITAFIQYCLVPRILASSLDALYCYQFVRRLVENQVPHYNHVHFVRRVLFVLLSLLRGVTEAEASNISIFLVELFTDLSVWYEKENEYSSKCEKNSCFMNDSKKGDNQIMTYDMYKKKYNYWMKFISVIIISALQSQDMLHVRNSLNFLQRMRSVYPRHTGYGKLIYPFLENLMFMDNGGIKTSAEMLLNDMKMNEK